MTNGSARRPRGCHFHSAQFNNNAGEEDGVQLKRGQMMGDFNFGSTIVLVFEAPAEFRFSYEPGDRVQLGQALGLIGDGGDIGRAPSGQGEEVGPIGDEPPDSVGPLDAATAAAVTRKPVRLRSH